MASLFQQQEKDQSLFVDQKREFGEVDSQDKGLLRSKEEDRKREGTYGTEHLVEQASGPGEKPKQESKKRHCYRCGKLGHIQKYCRVNLDHLNEEKPASRGSRGLPN